MSVYNRKNQHHLRSFYNNIKTLPLLYKYQFVVQFVRGGTITSPEHMPNIQTLSFYDFFRDTSNDPEKTFTYYAQSASVPGLSVKNAQAKFFAGKFNIPSVIQYDHSWTTDIILDQDLTMYKKLVQWQKYMSDYTRSGGGVRVIPNIDLRVSLLNSYHNAFSTSFILAGIWPNTVSGIDIKYDNNVEVMKSKITFSYQYVYQDPDFDSNGANDPLKV